MLSPLGVAILVLVAYPLGRVVYNVYLHPLSHLPGPRTWAATRLPFIWALLRGTIVHDFERLHRQYGPVVRTAPNEVSFSSGDAWTDIFATRPDNRQFLKDPLWWAKPPGKPNSLLSAISPSHHAGIRKLLSPAFSSRALRAQEPVLQKYVNLLVERLREQIVQGGTETELDIAPWLNYTAFDIFGDLGLGESFDCLQNSRYDPWISLVFNSVKAVSFISATRYYPLIEFLLKKCIPASLSKKAERHQQQIAEKVDRRLSWEVQRPDVMSYLIDEDGKVAWSRGELDATFQILTTAGSETTATVLTGIICYLVNNPDKLAIVTDEVRQELQGSEDVNLVSIRRLTYLNAVINEGLRLCPPVPWMLPRIVPEGGEVVCGKWLPAGTSVSLQAYSLNRDPESFHNATSFLPERWLPDASTDTKSPFFNDDRHAVHPFSAGPRACLGQHLAWAEMQLILAGLLLSFDIEAVENKRLQWEDLRTFLLVEKRPLELRLRIV
ncbi:cytochrome P450 [Penicillium angulare]|uniref:Cytochrome P450 n=1 Tax=Penicillium angulare TaxID=116970 RepID=A0A9W9FXG4_9EURO|nr:cytochrome P450 [Penicillium angulare]